MANPNLERLLTDFGRQQSSQEYGTGTFGQRMAGHIADLTQGMMTGVGQVAAGSGIKALENVDMRPAKIKLQERLGRLDPFANKEDRKEYLQILNAVAGPEYLAQAQQQFAAVDKKEADDLKKRNGLLRIAEQRNNQEVVAWLEEGGDTEVAMAILFKPEGGKKQTLEALTKAEKEQYGRMLLDIYKDVPRDKLPPALQKDYAFEFLGGTVGSGRLEADDEAAIEGILLQAKRLFESSDENSGYTMQQAIIDVVGQPTGGEDGGDGNTGNTTSTVPGAPGPNANPGAKRKYSREQGTSAARANDPYANIKR